MKRTGVARTPLRRGENLQAKIEAQLSAIKRMPQLIRSFYKAPSVSYMTDCIKVRTFATRTHDPMPTDRRLEWSGSNVPNAASAIMR